MKLIRKILKLILLFILALIIFCFGYYFAVTSSVKLAPEKLTFKQENVCVYDCNGAPVNAVLDKGEIKSLSISQIPKNTLQAFIATEDKRFFAHHGFDYRRIAKAIVSNLKSGRFEQGASTISQQLIKNTHLSQEKTLKRKLREWKLTKALERKYTKNEILEKYLSVIYFGHNCFGLRSASRFYFGKEVEELDLADSAILAGLVKSPNNYSPFKSPTACAKRKAVVLSLMQKNGSITQEEKVLALQKPLPTQASHTNESNSYMRFVFDELAHLSQEYQFTVGGNIKIYTYLDTNIQNGVQEIANGYTQSDKNLTVLDTKSHGFKACVSTVGDIARSPGSLLKPLLVYAPAIEENLISPATPILDNKINYNGYSPSNYDGKYHGYTSARDCIAQSLNVPAVKLLETLGVSRAVEYLNLMDLQVEKDDYSLTLALGGMKNGFSLKKLLSAYSVFANDGNFTPCGFISEIKIDNQRVYSKPQKAQRVFSEDSAYLMTDMLKSAVTHGTAKKLRGLPFEISAKTGTAGVSKGNTDAYALSYTTSDIIGVWLGNANNELIDSTGGGMPCNLLLKINEYLYKNTKPAPFHKPNSVVQVALDKPSYDDTHTLRLADTSAPAEYKFLELFKKDNMPKTQSQIFSKPVIIKPSIVFENNKIVINFCENSPKFYQYKIERYDYQNRTTLYFGNFLPTFIDDTVDMNKRYIYTITPFYNNTAGTPITLPSVCTIQGAGLPNDEILDKDWWKY